MPCEILDWDTNFFGFRIARVCDHVLTPERIQILDDFCRQKQVRCLYFLSNIDDRVTTRLAETHAYHLVDIRLTFHQPVNRGSQTMKAGEFADRNETIRQVQSCDLSHLEDLSRNCFTGSRFYFDLNFPRDRVDAFYQTWIKVSCEGWAASVFVALSGEKPSGYITCHLDCDQKTGNIGLISVSKESQGRGVGKALVSHALNWFTTQGIENVTVVTQGRNFPAQRLFQRCGFILHNTQLWYHKWYPLPR